ncbi:MAG: hypothetical protein ABI907_04565, partial [Ramlibacter sp.]
RLIGPLARVLVRKARPLAGSVQALRDALAASIQEPKAREAFIAGTHGQSHPSSGSAGHSHPVSRPSGTSRPPSSSRTSRTSQWGSLPASSQSMPLSSRASPSQSQPASQLRSQPQSQPVSQLQRSQLTQRNQPMGQPSRSRPDSTRQVDIPPDEMVIVEHTLSKFIGPMAKVLIRKEIGHCIDFKEFVVAIAGNIDHVQQREVFVQALKRALPKRQF